MRTQIDIEILKKHYPACAVIFDQIASKQKSEAEYKAFKAECEAKKGGFDA